MSLLNGAYPEAKFSSRQPGPRPKKILEFAHDIKSQSLPGLSKNIVMSVHNRSVTASEPETNGQVTKSKHWIRKTSLLDVRVIISDLEDFSCRCTPSNCLSMKDIAFLGEVRQVVAKLGSRSKVSLHSR